MFHRSSLCYIAGIAILLVAIVLFKLRCVRASHATARLGERIGGAPALYQQLGLRGLARREPLRCFTAGAAIRAQASVNEITLVANSLPLSLGCFQWAGGGYA
jgi:hypothetical protein